MRAVVFLECSEWSCVPHEPISGASVHFLERQWTLTSSPSITSQSSLDFKKTEEQLFLAEIGKDFQVCLSRHYISAVSLCSPNHLAVDCFAVTWQEEVPHQHYKMPSVSSPIHIMVLQAHFPWEFKRESVEPGQLLDALPRCLFREPLLIMYAFVLSWCLTALSNIARGTTQRHWCQLHPLVTFRLDLKWGMRRAALWGLSLSPSPQAR